MTEAYIYIKPTDHPERLGFPVGTVSDTENHTSLQSPENNILAIHGATPIGCVTLYDTTSGTIHNDIVGRVLQGEMKMFPWKNHETLIVDHSGVKPPLFATPLQHPQDR